MSANRKSSPVTTPLHLLQQLSQSLLEHLEEACTSAQKDAEKILADHEKQRTKAQDKLHAAREKLEQAIQAGKAKARAKAEASIAELEGLISSLKTRQEDTLAYVAQLKRDAEETLSIAKGIDQVKAAAADALQRRETDSVKRASSATKASKADAKPAAAKKASAKTASASSTKSAAQAKSASAKPSSKAATAASKATKEPNAMNGTAVAAAPARASKAKPSSSKAAAAKTATTTVGPS